MTVNTSNDPIADLISGRFPDARGRFGPFGGRYVPETLIPALERLERGVRQHLRSAEFQEALGRELRSWVGRPAQLVSSCASSCWKGALCRCCRTPCSRRSSAGISVSGT